MLVIGLTGGIASGKSTVAKLFAEQGISIIDADNIARQLVSPPSPYLDAVRDKFGDGIIDENGELRRRQLREIIFDNTDAKKWLEDLLHPVIREEMAQQIKKAKPPYCIVEIPLLFESGRAAYIDRVLLVDVPENLQKERASKRDQQPSDHIARIIAQQVSRQQKLALADDIIDNTGNMDDLRAQVEKLHQTYSSAQ